MSFPTRLLESATQLTRSAVSGHGQAQELEGLMQEQKRSVSRPRTSIHDESGPSSLKNVPNRNSALEVFKTQQPDRNVANDELDRFLVERGSPLDVPLVEEPFTKPSPIIPDKIRDLCNKIYKVFPSSRPPRFDNWVTDSHSGRCNNWHQRLKDLGVTPEEVFEGVALTKLEFHDQRCSCDDSSHYKTSIARLFFLALNDPDWYRFDDASSWSNNDGIFQSLPGTSSSSSEKPLLSLDELPVKVDTSISELEVNMAWLHDPYCACRDLRHRAQLRKEWQTTIKALQWADHHQKNLEDYLLEHMGVARRLGFIGQELSDEAQQSKHQVQEATRVNMISNHTGMIATQDTNAEDLPERHDFVSKLFPDYAILPLESRPVPHDVLVTRYQQLAGAAMFSFDMEDRPLVLPESFDIPSLLQNSQRQEEAYHHWHDQFPIEDARARSLEELHLTVYDRMSAHAGMTRFSSNVEQARSGTPISNARRMAYRAYQEVSHLRSRAAQLSKAQSENSLMQKTSDTSMLKMSDAQMQDGRGKAQMIQQDQSSRQQHNTHDPKTMFEHKTSLRPKHNREETSVQDEQMEPFHCPYPACHDLLAGGDASLRVSKDGRQEIWCAHDGCLESFVDRSYWRRHIFTPHHELLGLGTSNEL